MHLPPLDETASHEMLRLLAYHPQDYDDSVLSISDPPTHITDLVHRPLAYATLGDIDALPVELINEVLRYSDLRTVATLRILSRRAREVVDTSVPYKHILLHAPHVITALARTGAASHFTVDEVFYTLSTAVCYVCGEFGSFLWIPECIQCCFLCLREAPELMPMGERDAKAAFGLTTSGLAGVPIMVTLPGKYGPLMKLYRKTWRLLSRTRARQAALVVHGGEEGLTRYIDSGGSSGQDCLRSTNGTESDQSVFRLARENKPHR
jgi:hypothetical protein